MQVDVIYGIPLPKSPMTVRFSSSLLVAFSDNCDGSGRTQWSVNQQSAENEFVISEAVSEGCHGSLVDGMAMTCLPSPKSESAKKCARHQPHFSGVTH